MYQPKDMTKADEVISNFEHDNETMIPNSVEEQCGFVLHIISVLSSIYYSAWILSCHWSSSLMSRNSDYYNTPNVTATYHLISKLPLVLTLQPPLYTYAIPLLMLILFFMIPILYGCCINKVSPHYPKNGSLFMIQDQHTMVPSFVAPSVPKSCEQIRGLNGLPIIMSFIDIQNIQRYYRDPRQWTTHPMATEEFIDPASNSIPDMCDIDVADINDLIWLSDVHYMNK
jgi:hypothetical protein